MIRLKLNHFANALILAFMAVCAVLLPTQFCLAESQSEALTFVKKWRTENNEKLNKSSLEIVAALKSATEVKLNKNESSDPTAALNAKINKLTVEKNEFKARDELIDRLYFLVEQNFRGDGKTDNGKQFLEEALLRLALQETKSNDSSALKLANFLTNAVVALKEVAEPTDPPFSFFRQYLEFSTLLAAKNPSQFAAQRHYSNGKEAVSAMPASKEDAAAQAAEITTPPPAPIAEAPQTDTWKKIADQTLEKNLSKEKMPEENQEKTLELSQKDKNTSQTEPVPTVPSVEAVKTSQNPPSVLSN
ncbi:MAG: hypothetical protein AB7O96_07915 [Pseudobdellovibrionaceae bacterium]